MRNDRRLDCVKYKSICVWVVIVIQVLQTFIVVSLRGYLERVIDDRFRDAICSCYEGNRHPIADQFNIGFNFSMRWGAMPIKLLKGMEYAHPEECGE